MPDSLLEGIPAIVLFGPPFGVGDSAARAIGRIHPDAGMRPIVGSIAALVIGLAITVPWISTGFL